MRRHILAILVLLALAGLTFIQFRLLLIGVRFEKQRFDQRTETALQEVAKQLDQPSALHSWLLDVLKKPGVPPESAPALSLAIDSLLIRELRKNNVSTPFSFAITEKYGEVPHLVSATFDREKFEFGRYTALLGNRIINGCHCERMLQLNVENLFGYLLRELDYLFIPSALCLLTILGCLAFLIRILRREEKLNLIKNDFINNLTHELKTPAFSISLSTRLAKENLENGNPAKVRQLLQLIENENNRLKTHIEKVLELASLETPHHQLQKEKTDLHRLVREVTEEFSPQVESREGKLSLQLEADRFELEADPSHLKNVLRNLFDNALKYSPGAPEIEVRSRNEGHFFKLSVRDNGIGIAAAHRKLVFDKFYRVPVSNLHQVKGFGLGLSYVRQVLEAHGGRVEVESYPDSPDLGRGEGAGSVFRISLPMG